MKGTRIGPKRPSPAMIVAVTALVLAVTGAAVALPGRNTVDSGDIKNSQVKKADLNKKVKPRWVFVNGDTGDIYNQSGGIRANRVQEGVYDVNFGSSVRNYAITATNNDAGGGAQDVVVSAERCGEAPGDQEFCGGVQNNPKFLDVHTVHAPGTTSLDADFTILAVPK